MGAVGEASELEAVVVAAAAAAAAVVIIVAVAVVSDEEISADCEADREGATRLEGPRAGSSRATIDTSPTLRG